MDLRRKRVAGMRLLIILWVTAVLAGCAATGPQNRAGNDKALNNHVQLALAYIGTGDRDSARYHLAQVSDLNRRAPSVLHAYALLYQLEGEFDVADSYYRRALAADRGFSRARLNYGVFLYGQQHFQDAYRQFKMVTEDLDYEMRAVAFSHLGLAAVKLERNQEAMTAFQRAIQLEPTLARPYLELAQLEFAAGDYSRSKSWLDQYHRLAPSSAASLWLGVRLASIFGDRDGEASNALALRNLFPYSEETLAYQKWLDSQNDPR